MRVRARKHVRNEGSRRFKSAPLHHPVHQFSGVSENRLKSARVRAIFDCAWTRRTLRIEEVFLDFEKHPTQAEALCDAGFFSKEKLPFAQRVEALERRRRQLS